MQKDLTTRSDVSLSSAHDLRDWPGDTVLLVLTFAGMETYIPEVLENLDLFWPDRPETFVVTNGALEGDNVIRVRDSEFVLSLHGALRKVRARAPDKKHVFLMLEDLCPLWHVDAQKLNTMQGFVRQSGIKFISHSWKVVNQAPWEDGRWKRPDTIQHVEDIQVIRMPPYYRAYNAVGASFWDFDHLQRVVRRKRRRKMLSPWEFERPLNRHQPDHYLVDDSWPTVRHGFFQKGRHNPMIAKRKMPESPLLSRLLKEHAA